MAKTRKQKEQVIDALAEKIKSAKSVIIANQEGLTVAASEELRNNCKAENVEFIAAKKTLIGLALAKAGLGEVDAKAMQGSLAVAISNEDEVTPARILKDFGKKFEQVDFRAGVVEGQLVTVETVRKLASLPSKQELLAKVVGSLKAPISGFTNVLAGNLRGLINVLNAIKENK